VINLVKHDQTQGIMHSIVAAAGLKTEAKGLSFALPVTNVKGIVHSLEEMEGVQKEK